MLANARTLARQHEAQVSGGAEGASPARETAGAVG